MLSPDQSLAVTLAILVALASVILAVIAGGTLDFSKAGAGTPGVSPSCVEWTDGCVVCQRDPGGLACSTPGIACTPTQPRCLGPAGVPI